MISEKIFIDPILAFTTLLNEKVEKVQENQKLSCKLWAGYGKLFRLKVDLKEDSLHKNTKCLYFAHKYVDSPLDVNEVGHIRKIRSYINEELFYRCISPLIKKCGLNTGIPNAISSESYANGKNQIISIVMSDLSIYYPIESPFCTNKSQTIAACKWLAEFHSYGWNKDLDEIHGLAKEGGYWYLETRKHEWENIPPDWSDLKDAAQPVSERLKSKGSGKLGWTLIHGDFKAANLLFTSPVNNDESFMCECAAIDFQYCGGGYGARDLVMLIVCACEFTCDDLATGIDVESEVLELYYNFLCEFIDESEIISLTTLHHQYELALIDFVRFMSGWGFWGNSTYACERVRALMLTLNRGKKLSESEYRNILAIQYP